MNIDRPTQSDISLIIPSYNRGKYISETIDRALNQTDPFREIIVVNDGSTDNTLEVLSNYQSRITVINQRNGGVQKARNTGVHAAKSTYVTFCDDDDRIRPEYVNIIGNWLTGHPDVDVVYCNFVAFNEKGELYDKFKTAPAEYFKDAEYEGDFIVSFPDLLRQTVRFQPLFPTGMTVKKDYYEAIGGFYPKYSHVTSEDWNFVLRVIASGKVHICTLTLTEIRKHSGNQSGEPIAQGMGEATILEDALKEIPALKEYEEEVRKSISLRRLSSYDAAFAKGQFEKCMEIKSLIYFEHKNYKFQLKNIILQCPSLLRDALWNISQGK